MEIKKNKPVDLTIKINDRFFHEATNEFYDKTNLYDLFRIEASLNFKRTTDFRIFAEAVKFDKHIRYNYQLAIIKNKRVLINLN